MAVLPLVSCSDQPLTAADGLNLHAVMGLVKQARDGEHFENLLNTSGINNMDLDGDETVDYINVTEYGDGDFRGFSLSTTLHDNSVQQIAEIHFQRTLSGVIIQLHGNAQIYGPNYYIRSAQPMTLSQAMFLHWMFSPRVVYASAYNRHHLPPSYAVIRVVPVTTYRTVTKTVVETNGVKVEQVQKAAIVPTVKSPNEGKASTVVVAPLKEPTRAQKEFQARTETREIQKAAGFGKKRVEEPVKVQGRTIQEDKAPAGRLDTKTVLEKDKTGKAFQEREVDKRIPDAKGFVKKDKEVKAGKK